MLTGELRNKIDRLWETFWTGGITNPLDVVEQMTYLMFIHDLDATDNLRQRERHARPAATRVFSGECRSAGAPLQGNSSNGRASFLPGKCTPVVQEQVSLYQEAALR